MASTVRQQRQLSCQGPWKPKRSPKAKKRQIPMFTIRRSQSQHHWISTSNFQGIPGGGGGAPSTLGQAGGQSPAGSGGLDSDYDKMRSRRTGAFGWDIRMGPLIYLSAFLPSTGPKLSPHLSVPCFLSLSQSMSETTGISNRQRKRTGPLFILQMP